MKPPTARQRQAYDAVQRTGGTVAAALDLDIGISTLCNLVKLYCERANLPYPAGMVRRDGSGSPRTVLVDVVGQIEASIKGLLERERVRDATLVELVALIRELNARQPLLLMGTPVTHRRQSDGGVGGKRERGERP